MPQPHVHIGTAGWNVPRELKQRFPAEGTHLQRYAANFNAVEINSSFYKPHRESTYQRWAACVPADFRFSVKLPKLMTHKKRFVDVEKDLEEFFRQATSLGEKLGPILIQLPPSFAFDQALTEVFFARVRDRFTGQVCLEPRHATWTGEAAEALLADFRITRVWADPPAPSPVPADEPFDPLPPVLTADPAGGFHYIRLHGSPRVYYSPYPHLFLHALAKEVDAARLDLWCIFDNTAIGYAAADALELKTLLDPAATG